MDIKVNTRESGTGETLILLHGNGEDSSYFEPQIAFFSAYYHVLAIDSRGHGKTPTGEKPITLRQFAEDLHDFLIEQKISSAHILGFSDGANIAMLFALKYPEMISSLILYGGNINPSGVKTGLQIQTCICLSLKDPTFCPIKSTIICNDLLRPRVFWSGTNFPSSLM